MLEYLSQLPYELRTLLRAGKPISHHQTCPACGRTLINLYKRGGVWKCKKCWDAEERGEDK